MPYCNIATRRYRSVSTARQPDAHFAGATVEPDTRGDFKSQGVFCVLLSSLCWNKVHERLSICTVPYTQSLVYFIILVSRNIIRSKVDLFNGLRLEVLFGVLFPLANDVW